MKNFMQKIKAICSICLYGDGKWDAGRNTKGYSHLDICHFCAGDGWKVATSKDILSDEQLSGRINHLL